MNQESTCRTELFLNKYRELEAAISAEYNLPNSESAIGFLLRRQEYRSIREELDYCREVRNLLTHNPRVNRQYAVEPSQEMIALLDRTIDKIRNPIRAKHIYVPRSRVVCRTMEDSVYDTMLQMRERMYTHIPIVQEDVVIGVFSENTLLNYLLADGNAGIDRKLTFADIRDYLPMEENRAETFYFVPRNMPLADMEAIFSEGLKHSERIGLLFVTGNGKPHEKLQGIISAWDVAGAD